MTGTCPVDPADQVAFLLNVQRLLGEGSFVATYKFALLHALADLALAEGDDGGAELRLETPKIAERLVELYWRQAAPHEGGTHTHSLVGAGTESPPVRQLLQNTGRQAAIIGHIAEVGMSRSLGRFRRDEPAAWRMLVTKVDATLRKMPLWKLQTVGSEAVEFLYANDPGQVATSIVLRPGVAYCLRTYHGLVTELCRGAWLRFIRRQNRDLEQGNVDLSSFLFGRERESLNEYRQPLLAVQSGECFYCRQSMGSEPGQVDHFVPWARYAADLPHNFVLAHANCNRHKSDLLAGETHLERWVERNTVSTGIFVEATSQSVGDAVSRRAHNVARWAYAQNDASKLRVWSRGRQMEVLTGRWRAVLG